MPKPETRTTSKTTDQVLKVFGNLIHEARIERSLTMEELATRAGVSRSLLQRIIKGDPGSSIGAVFEVATVLGVPLLNTDPDLQKRPYVNVTVKKPTLLPKRVRKPKNEVKDDF